MAKPVAGAALLLVLGVGGAAGGAPSGADEAAGSATCAVRLIHAGRGDSANPIDREARSAAVIDQKLEPLRGQLTKPPFSAWRSFRLLQQHDLTLPARQPTAFTLPGYHSGSLTYLGLSEKSKKPSLKLRLELKDGAAKLATMDISLNNGGTFMQAGTRHEDGILILGITCQRPST